MKIIIEYKEYDFNGQFSGKKMSVFIKIYSELFL